MTTQSVNSETTLEDDERKADGFADRNLEIMPSGLGELAQAKVRCAMNIILIALALSSYAYDPTLGLDRVMATFVFTASSAAMLYFWAFAIFRYDLRGAKRIGQRIASILLDSVSITWILWFGDAALAGVFGLYLWITVGNGTRYGQRYLYGTLAASLVGFAFVATTVEFWLRHPALSVGLGLTLVVVPLYAAFLIQRLRHAIWEANQAYRAKSDFIARMSHELRTPLHAIISLTELLGASGTNPKQLEMTRLISISSQSLLELINRILDISKYESEGFVLQSESMDLYGPISSAINILFPQAQSKALTFSVFVDPAIEPRLIGSPVHIEEILVNICGNAIKFTETGFVHMSIIRRSNDPILEDICIEISDSGPGIDQELIPKVFDPFFQGDSRITRRHGGTGLGTSISRELVRLMNGTIEISSEVGHGTTVKIALRLKRDHQTSLRHADYALTFAAIGFAERGTEAIEKLRTLGVSVINVSDADHGNRLSQALIDAILVNTETIDGAADHARRLLPARATDAGLQVIAYARKASTPALVSKGFISAIDYDSDDEQYRRVVNIISAVRKSYLTGFSASSLARRLRILVADDNPTNQSVLRMILEQCGHECVSVSDGEAALMALEGETFDVGIIDMHMPSMDGIEMAKLYNFAHTSQSQRTPLIMLTADSRPEAIADADMAGIQCFLVRPTRPSVLLEAIVRVTSGKANRLSGDEPAENSNQTHETLDSRNQAGPLLDMEIVEELFMFLSPGDRRRFLDEFLEDGRGYVQAAYNIRSVSDIAVFRERMHALYGAARTVGAIGLANCARRAEYETAEGLTIRSSEIAANLEHLLTASYNELIEAGLCAPNGASAQLS